MAIKRRRRLMGEINVVPYIDVMLVLLIIFMVTAPLLTQGVQVELPDADAKPIDPEILKDREPLVLSVDRDGRYYLNVGGDEDSPVSEAEVARRAGAVIAQDAEMPVLVKADERVPYGSVVRGMVILQQAGASKIRPEGGAGPRGARAQAMSETLRTPIAPVGWSIALHAALAGLLFFGLTLPEREPDVVLLPIDAVVVDRPAATAKAPTADSMLPQFGPVSTRRSTTFTWANR